MNRLFPLITLGLCFTLACGKEKPGGTTPPDSGDAPGGETAGKDPGGKGDKGDKGDKGGKGGDEKPPGEDPTQKVCDAMVGEAPTPFFADTVLIRLPKGLTGDNLVEFQPGFARAGEVESVGCVEGMPGAMISFTVLGLYQDDGKKKLEDLRTETLTSLGYPAGVKFSEEKIDAAKRTMEAVIDIPADPANNKDVGRAWYVMKSAHGRMHFVLYETHPNAWNALKKTFKASGEKFLFLPG